MTTKELRNKAADYIEQHGWTRGSMECNGRVCIMGALRAVAFGDPHKTSGRNFKTYDEVYSELVKELRQSPVRFNDSIAKSGRAVIARLRSAD